MAKPHLSFSQLSMFLRCPRQYCFRYIDGLKVPPSGAMVQSRAWHQAVEHNYTQKVESDQDVPVAEVQEVFAARFDEAVGSEEIAFDAGADPAKLKDQGVGIVAVHHEAIAPAVRPELVEERFRLDLGNEFPFDLVGVWDLVERDGTVVDNKAYSKTPSQADLDKDLQFTAYSLAYRATRDAIEPGLRMDAVIKNKKLKAVQLTTSRTNDDCRWFLGLVEQVASAIDAGNFYPNPNGWHCSHKFCGYWDRCRPKTDGR